MTSLEKYVLTYEDVNGKIVVNIPDYYDNYIAPLEGKFKQYSFHNKGTSTVVCPLHNDHDPSLGMMKDRRLPKVMLYHCLGCGAVGTVIRLHQRIQHKYYNREITIKQACVELCELFGIPVPTEDVFDSEDYSKRIQNRSMKVDKVARYYTEKDYARNILLLRKEAVENGGMNLNRLNSECVKMIATTKGLYTR